MIATKRSCRVACHYATAAMIALVHSRLRVVWIAGIAVKIRILPLCELLLHHHHHLGTGGRRRR